MDLDLAFSNFEYAIGEPLTFSVCTCCLSFICEYNRLASGSPVVEEPDATCDVELAHLMIVMTEDLKECVRESDAEVMGIIRSLGGDKKKYVRERGSALKRLVAEI